MKLKNKLLNQLKDNNTFVDVYTDLYDESFFGFILDFNSTFLVLEYYSENSVSDGVCVFFRENVSRIRWEGNEISTAFKLIQEKKKSEEMAINITSLSSVIKSMSELYGYVVLNIQDLDSEVCFIGEINEMDEETILIHEFGSKISLDRKFILLNLEDITKVDAGGLYEEQLKGLYLN